MQSPFITVSQAARYYIFKADRTVRHMCENGIFKSARQIGTGTKPRWQILRREVIQYCGQKANKQ